MGMGLLEAARFWLDGVGCLSLCCVGVVVNAYAVATLLGSQCRSGRGGGGGGPPPTSASSSSGLRSQSVQVIKSGRHRYYT